MNQINNGGLAFPTADHETAHSVAIAAIEGIQDSAERDRVYTAARAQAQQGMSLRDYAAIAAMQALVTGHITHFGHENHWPPVDVARYAGEIADAMLAERAK